MRRGTWATNTRTRTRTQTHTHLGLRFVHTVAIDSFNVQNTRAYNTLDRVKEHFGWGGAMFCSQNIWWDVSTIFAIFGGGTMSS